MSTFEKLISLSRMRVIFVSSVFAGLLSCLPLAVAEEKIDFADLSEMARDVMNRKCYSCHHTDDNLRNESRVVAGEFPISDLAELAYWLEPGNGKESDIVAMVQSINGAAPEMPKSPKKPLTDAEVKILEEWINCMPAGFDLAADTEENRGCSVQDATAIAPNVRHVSLEEVYGSIEADVDDNLYNHPSLSSVRYVTIANLANLGTYSAEELDVARAALSRGINSVSRAPQLARFEPIDDEQLTFRFFLNDLNWTEWQWEALMSEYPYRGYPADAAATEVLRQIRRIEREVGTKDILVRGDWLLRAITHPGRYDALLGIPQDLHGLEARDNGDGKLHLGIDLRSNLAANRVIRAGFQSDDRPFSAVSADGKNVPRTDSGVSGAARIIERQDIGEYQGYYWKSFDFRQNSDGNIAVPAQPFDDQLRRLMVELGQVQEFNLSPFRHDGGEMIFSLPNGLQGYWVTTAEGDRLEAAPHDIVNWSYSGKNEDEIGNQTVMGKRWEFNQLGLYPSENNLRRDSIYNGLACMSCHTQGMRQTGDFVGAYFSQPKSLLGAYQPNFDEQESILRIYDNARINEAYKADTAAFANGIKNAYRAIGLDQNSRGWSALVKDDRTLQDIDPVTFVVHRYTYGLEKDSKGTILSREQLLASIAGEFWMSPAVLQRYLDRGNFAALQNAIADRQISREFGLGDQLGLRTFECEFAQIARGLGWTNINLDLINQLEMRRSICSSNSDGFLYPSTLDELGNAQGSPGLATYTRPDLSMTLAPTVVEPGGLFSISITTDAPCELWLIDLNPDNGLARIIRPGKFLPGTKVPGEILLGNQLKPGAPLVISNVQAENKVGIKEIGAVCTVGGAASAGLSEEFALDLFRPSTAAEQRLEFSLSLASSNVSEGLTTTSPHGGQLSHSDSDGSTSGIQRGGRLLASSALNDRLAVSIAQFLVVK